ncbi:MAG: protein kinase [Burkholderiales bacterium]|nr:protein kinase [Burkholderiales bacterium]MDR4516986.1 protein kinase [Nitrosomonas sp.]
MDVIGPYKIIEKIGEGGMGEVYKGLDTMLEREVAIKLMRPELINRQEIVDRFKSEAIATGRLNHSNITTLYNFGQENDQYYMALEFVPGKELEKILQNGALPWRKAVEYAIAALEGLEYAHQLGIVHRDLKPSNIMVHDQGTVKIMDFGIARILGKARLTKTGNFIGTLEYTPPEQIQGKEGDARSDIYSLGAVLYEMLTGNTLFTGTTEFELMNAQIKEKPRALRKLKPEIPAKLEKIVLQAVEKDPAKRFTSAKEFSTALQQLVRESGHEPKSPGSLAYFWKNYPAVVIAVALLVPGGVFILWHMDTTAPDTAPQTAAIQPEQSTQQQITSSPPPNLLSDDLSAPVDYESYAPMDPQPQPEFSDAKIPQLALIPDPGLGQPLPDLEEVEPFTDIDDSDFATPKTGQIPIPVRKPESIKNMQPVRTVETTQPRKATSQRTEQPAPVRQQTSPAAPQPNDDEDIGEWAKGFFGEN